MAEAASWVCCQLGAREHYAIPRALHRRGSLDSLETDIWFPEQGFCNSILPASLRDRSHADLASAKVRSRNLAAITFEAGLATRHLDAWPSIVRRNDWFQETVRRSLRRRPPRRAQVLFSFSYAARSLLEHARNQGWRTVLGQIDPGPGEERLVSDLHRETPDLAPGWEPAPEAYWRSWREECGLADIIMVNSEWSRRLLVLEGIPERKLRTVPLAYDPPVEALGFRREYPGAFTSARPLRALVLGQVNLRKGFRAIYDAMPLLSDAPVELWFVGARRVAEHLGSPCRSRWVGAVPRSAVPGFLREADLLLFPTLSDGFGMTQLEAQAWKLPILVSRHCAEVVRDGVNGLVLDQVSGRAIAKRLRELADSPDILAQMSAHSTSLDAYSVASLGDRLAALLDASAST